MLKPHRPPLPYYNRWPDGQMKLRINLSVLPSYHLTILPSYRLTILLSYYLTILLSYYLTIILKYPKGQRTCRFKGPFFSFKTIFIYFSKCAEISVPSFISLFIRNFWCCVQFHCLIQTAQKKEKEEKIKLQIRSS